MHRGSQRALVSQMHRLFHRLDFCILVLGVQYVDQYAIHKSFCMSALTIETLLSSSPLL